MAAALGREAIRQNHNVQFITAATLVATLAKAHNDGLLDKQLTILPPPNDIGGIFLVFVIFRGRYDRKRNSSKLCALRSFAFHWISQHRLRLQ
ncbi:ATP-binding protein [Mesorhizobium sp. GbtcB19]|uniref:ATP-binding protein n=1 Tax=Mesorhizobium sp. GbtcB19 TaxID=2824764 RepID=UPI0027D27B95|nr:ATP-binding protein [Mesorhizobium sp. GbtcB19]